MILGIVVRLLMGMTLRAASDSVLAAAGRFDQVGHRLTRTDQDRIEGRHAQAAKASLAT
jgi:hypothetical protein